MFWKRLMYPDRWSGRIRPVLPLDIEEISGSLSHMISDLSANQLRRAAEIKDKIESLQSELSKILGGGTEVGNGLTASKRGRPPGHSSRKPGRRMSAAARARIAAVARARWAKAKKAGQNRL